MKREALRHPKTFDLAAKLNCELPAAIGYLTLLFDFTGAAAPQGDVGKWDDEAIARACEWRGEPAHFVQSLCASRWLDANKTFRYLVHDWGEHCEEWVKKRLKRNDLEPHKHVATLSRRRRDNGSLPSLTKPNQAKPNQALETAAAVELPLCLQTDKFREAWKLWIAHLIVKKKPMNVSSAPMAVKKLEKLGHDRAVSAIENSIANNYQGIFEEKDAGYGKRNHERSGPGQVYQGPPIAVATRHPT